MTATSRMPHSRGVGSPSLLRRRDDAWEGRFVLVPPRPVRSVSAASGLVVAGGDALYMLRPGAERLRARELPPDLGLLVVAAEPWAPFRYAVAARGRIAVFSGAEPDEPLVEIELTDPRRDATHLAWTRHEGEPALFVRSRNGAIARLRLDRNAFEDLDCPPMEAVASDASGALAMLSLAPDEEAAWVSKPDGSWELRPLTTIPVADEGDDAGLHLVIAGPAVAYSADGIGTYVSWEREADFDRCGDLFWGPVAFQDEGALFSAYSVETTMTITRFTRQGDVTRIAEIEAGGEEAEPTITAVAWDAPRRTLWAASPEAGLLACTEPVAKGGKRVSLN